MKEMREVETVWTVYGPQLKKVVSCYTIEEATRVTDKLLKGEALTIAGYGVDWMGLPQKEVQIIRYTRIIGLER